MLKKDEKLDNLLLKISIYTLATFTVAYIMSRIIFYVPDLWEWLCDFVLKFISLVGPLIYGLVIAYIIYPLVHKIRGFLFSEERNKKSKSKVKDNSKKENNKLEHEAKTKTEREIHEETNVLRRKKQKSAKWKTGVSVLATYILIVAFIYFIANLTYSAVAEKVTSVNLGYVVEFTKTTFEKYETEINEVTTKVMSLEIPQDSKEELLKLVDAAKTFITDFATGWMVSIKAIAANVVNFFIGLIIGFYIILDVELFKNIWNKFLYLFISKKSIIKVNSFIREIDKVLASFIRGQLLDCLIVAVISIIALSVIGLEFSVALGIFAGITNIIPYFGPVIGMVPAAIVGLLSGNPWQALFAIIALTVVQQFDCNILSPKIVGQSVGVHPVFVIIGILIGANLFGILGMILAVPTCGVIKVIVEKIINYKEFKEKSKSRTKIKN